MHIYLAIQSLSSALLEIIQRCPTFIRIKKANALLTVVSTCQYVQLAKQYEDTTSKS
jgi:hypothetical protein